MRPLPSDLQLDLEADDHINLVSQTAAVQVVIGHRKLELTQKEREAIGQVVIATLAKLQQSRAGEVTPPASYVPDVLDGA